jgi:hypothetical protein
MNFELSTGDIFVLFFLTLGPLKAILPFARGPTGPSWLFSDWSPGELRRSPR